MNTNKKEIEIMKNFKVLVLTSLMILGTVEVVQAAVYQCLSTYNGQPFHHVSVTPSTGEAGCFYLWDNYYVDYYSGLQAPMTQQVATGLWSPVNSYDFRYGCSTTNPGNAGSAQTCWFFAD